MTGKDAQISIAHVVFRFDVGGLENGVVNLINGLPADRYRHAIVAMTEVAEEFSNRIQRDDVDFVTLDKRPGPGFKLWPALYKALRALQPDIVHTRNLAALEATVPAWMAGIRVRIHGEHGWDIDNLKGENRSHRNARRFYRPFVSRYVALSRQIAGYLVREVGVAPSGISQIYNGVDAASFARRQPQRARLSGSPFNEGRLFVVGTVGRLVDVKDHATLIRALAACHRQSGDAKGSMRLAIIGAGPRQPALMELTRSEGLGGAVWFAGQRHDIPEVMRGLDLFALPSLAEGISNTILEAMSSSLPVVASSVGGNAELVDADRTGTLVGAGDVAALAAAMLRYFDSRSLVIGHGTAGRERIEECFSLQGMLQSYRKLYEASILRARLPGRQAVRERPPRPTVQ